MTLDDLKNQVRAAKLHPVHVEGRPIDGDPRASTVVGTLDEFFDTAKALGAPIVLIHTEILEEDDFFCMTHWTRAIR